tara:strand:+ start:412 stop:597 length:186 start_codon:yes stop_codon:yes gene_type:complete
MQGNLHGESPVFVQIICKDVAAREIIVPAPILFGFVKSVRGCHLALLAVNRKIRSDFLCIT